MLCPTCSTPDFYGAAACAVCGSPLRPGRDTASALPAGSRLQGGRYSIGRMLGRGGFGITYRGSETALQRPVAIKELFPPGCHRRGAAVEPGGDLDQFQAARDRFLEEARILARLDHPGIVAVYQVFEENQTAYMVMEHLKGYSLRKVLDERGPLSEQEALAWIRPVADALNVLHAAGLIHRDIKPENLIQPEDGRIVLVDFGAAGRFVSGQETRMPVLVTPGYAPLEQYSSHARFGPYTDVYALGATLYHLVTGTPPPSAVERAAGIHLRPACDLNPEVSTGVSDDIGWAMEMAVDRRPQSAAEFLKLLRPRRQAPVDPALSLLPESTPTPAKVPDSDAARLVVQVSGTDLVWPDRCACCGSAADATYPIAYRRRNRSGRRQTRQFEVPYCSSCLAHITGHNAQVALARRARWFLGAGACAGFAAIPSFFFSTAALDDPVVGYVTMAVCFLLSGSFIGCSSYLAMLLSDRKICRAALTAPSCTMDSPAATCTHFYGTVQTFHFASRDYADAFRRANVSRLVG